MQEKREGFHNRGYAVLAIGYFKADGTPDQLDRISLDAIAEAISKIAEHQQIDSSRIALIGGSKGGELVLNLASRYREFSAVIALSTSHVSFPALTWSANTSSWSYKGREVIYTPAPLKTIMPALKGDLYAAHAMMLEDKQAVKDAEIAVEQINGPILLISGIHDDQWPATEMSDEIIRRLQDNNFPQHYEHIKLDGGHAEPLNAFDKIYDFLDTNLKR